MTVSLMGSLTGSPFRDHFASVVSLNTMVLR